MSINRFAQIISLTQLVCESENMFTAAQNALEGSLTPSHNEVTHNITLIFS